MARLSIIASLSFWFIVCTAKRGGGGGGSSSGPQCPTIVVDVLNRTMEGISWPKSGDTEALIIDNDDSTRNVVNSATRGTNSKFEKSDAYYYGYLFITITPPTSGNKSLCSRIEPSRAQDAYLRIGSQNEKRKAYDPNPFYLEFGLYGSCDPYTIHFESSNDMFTHGQVWSLGFTTSSGNSEMDFSGNITTTKANSGNYFLVDGYADTGCPDHFFLRSMMNYNNVSLHGTASQSAASMDFTIGSGPVPKGSGTGSGVNPPAWPEGWVAQGYFEGSVSKKKDGRLYLMDGTLVTKREPVSKNTIIVASCVGAVILLALVGCCSWCCCISPRRQKRKAAKNGVMSS